MRTKNQLKQMQSLPLEAKISATKRRIIEYYEALDGDVLFNDNEYKLTGVNRTGCMFCLYGIHLEKSPNRIEKLKETHPSIYDYILRDSGLGFKKVMDYCNLKY